MEKWTVWLGLGLSLSACGVMQPTRYKATKGEARSQSYGNHASPLTSAAQYAGCKDSFAAQGTSEREDLCRRVSAYRATYGLPPVTLSRDLSLAAQVHAEDMQLKNYFEHTSPAGTTVTDRVAIFTSVFSTLGENIARGQGSTEQILTGWINSPGHRANILNRAFNSMGLGRAGTYWVQDFGG